MNCKDCPVRLFPTCDKGIPCCKCQDLCNSRQPCPKKEEKK